MKILHLCKMTGVAGTENHLLLLLPELVKCGMQVELLILVEPQKPMDAYAAQMNKLGIATSQYPIHGDLDISLINALAHRFRADKIDALHTHLIHADLHGLLAAKLAGVRRVFCSGHNDDPFRRNIVIRLFQAWFWRQLEAGIAISEAVRQIMIQVEFAPPNRIHTIHYGFQPPNLDEDQRAKLRTELGLNADTFLFGSVCRLIEQKGLPNALIALQKISTEFPIAHYAIIGDGVLRDTLQAQASELGIMDRIHFLGWRADARSLYGGFDCFLMPSLWEGFGLVVLEAMAVNLPVIASNVSALPEIVVDQETGYLVPAGDSNALANAMSLILREPQKSRQLGIAGRKRLEAEFSIEKMVSATVSVYGMR